MDRHSPCPRRLHEPPLDWARRTPDAPALSEGRTTWTYATLQAAMDEAGALLRQLGVRRGDRVMLVGENSLALAAFILAASAADASAVLENARRAPHEVDLIRRHGDPRMVLYFSGASADAQAHAERHGAVACTLPLNGRLHHLPQPADCAADAVAGGDGDTAVLIYTTGTTGMPKGVMLSHANLLYLSAMMGRLRQVTPADRVYGVLPITHVMGLAGAFNGTLRAGAHVRLVARFSPADCAQSLQAEGITMLQGAPAMFAKLVQYARNRPFTAPALRFIAAGGAPIDATVKTGTEALFGLPLHNGYGLTEGSGLCWTRIEAPRSDCSVGLPLPGVELQVLGPDGRPVPAGTVGELWARGPNVMKGYYRQADLTAKVLKPDGWFNTEDLARVDPADGHVHVEGRSKDLIIAGGFNVYPLEVEMALNAHEAVVHSAVVGRREDGSETVVAFLELAPGRELGLAELQAHLAPRLSPYKRPREIWVMPALPVSPNGKVLKKQLQALAQQAAPEGAARLC